MCFPFQIPKQWKHRFSSVALLIFPFVLTQSCYGESPAKSTSMTKLIPRDINHIKNSIMIKQSVSYFYLSNPDTRQTNRA